MQFLHGLADRTRLRIIKSLMEHEKTVSQLVNELNGSQANISAHLKTLKAIGVLQSRQQGKYVFYSLRDDSICEFLQYLEEMLLNMRKQALEGI